MADQVHIIVDQFAKLIELVGVAIIVGGIAIAAVAFCRLGYRTRDWLASYERLRSNLGRGILLGLELLVGADIISTITAPLTIESVGLLAGIVVIRTFFFGAFPLRQRLKGVGPGSAPPRNLVPATLANADLVKLGISDHPTPAFGNLTPHSAPLRDLVARRRDQPP